MKTRHTQQERNFALMGMIFCRFAERLKRYSSKSDVLQGRNGSTLIGMQARTEKRRTAVNTVCTTQHSVKDVNRVIRLVTDYLLGPSALFIVSHDIFSASLVTR